MYNHKAPYYVLTPKRSIDSKLGSNQLKESLIWESPKYLRVCFFLLSLFGLKPKLVMKYQNSYPQCFDLGFDQDLIVQLIGHIMSILFSQLWEIMNILSNTETWCCKYLNVPVCFVHPWSVIFEFSSVPFWVAMSGSVMNSYFPIWKQKNH